MTTSCGRNWHMLPVCMLRPATSSSTSCLDDLAPLRVQEVLPLEVIAQVTL